MVVVSQLFCGILQNLTGESSRFPFIRGLVLKSHRFGRGAEEGFARACGHFEEKLAAPLRVEQLRGLIHRSNLVVAHGEIGANGFELVRMDEYNQDHLRSGQRLSTRKLLTVYSQVNAFTTYLITTSGRVVVR